MDSLPELLAPAGSPAALQAAIANGADAVYLGGKRFGARQYAANFDLDEMNQAVDYAHRREVRVYVTVNTLLTDRELAELPEYIHQLYKIGVDAVIVQDLGVLRVIRRLFPALPVHASTQLTVSNREGVRLLREAGVQRVILARELSLPEIAAIGEIPGIETEVFVHGALCVGYSGQCLYSSLIGGRSGNRGRCAQPCRLGYRLVDRAGKPLVDPAVVGSYLLSPKDIKAIELLPALIETGIKALKIEGRMKRPEYVAVVVRQYRQALERLAGENKFCVQEIEEKALRQIFNRGFAPAYLQGNPGRELMSYQRPNNRGSYLGRVKAYHPGTGMVRIALAESLHPGDGIEVWVTRGGRVATVVKKLWSGGQRCQEGRPGDEVSLALRGAISPGDRVFKTHDAALIANAWESFRRPVAKGQVPVTAKVWAVAGHPVEVEFRDAHGRTGRAATVIPAQPARTNPFTPELLAKQLGRLGDTPFKLVQVELFGDQAVMVPWSELNAARRQAIAALESLRLAGWHRATGEELNWHRQLSSLGLVNPEVSGCPAGENFGQPVAGPVLTVAVEGLASLRAVLAAGVREVYLGTEGYRHGQPFLPGEEGAALDLCREAGAKVVIALPRLYRPEQKERVQATIDRWQAAGADAFLVGNLGYLELLANHGRQRVAGIRTDFSLWVFNAQAAAFLTDCGVEGFTLSPELSLAQWHSLVNAGLPAAGMTARQAEVVVHGPLPMMISEYCAAGALLGGRRTGKPCSGACRDHPEVFLEDRLKFHFPLYVDAYCRMHLMNAKELSLLGNLPAITALGVGRVRVEGRGKSPHWLRKVTKIYRQALAAVKAGAWEPDAGQKWKEELLRLHPAGYTKGHLFRGVD